MSRLRILWLSHFVPYPPKGGCFQRSYNLIRHVGAAHDVHLLALKHKRGTHPEEEAQEARTALLQHCEAVEIVDISRNTAGGQMVLRAVRGLATARAFNVAVYESDDLRARIRAALSSTAFDVVHVDTIGLAQYLPDLAGLPALMTHHGAESHMIHRRIRREPNVLKKGFFLFEWLALRRYERLMCPRVAANVVMSDDDGQIMAGIAPEATFVSVPNGVDIAYFTPVEPSGTHALVFAGRLDQYSNRDGLLHFLQSAWPQLCARYPDVVIDVLGSNPPEALERLASADPRIRVRGFVPDVRPYFASAAAAICPVRDGGGTRIKVLDALAQGMPLVSTSIGCEGIAVGPDEHVLIADTPEAFVAQIGRVFEDGALRARLAANGRRLVESMYSWTSLGDQLIQQYRVVAGLRMASTGMASGLGARPDEPRLAPGAVSPDPRRKP